MIKPQDIGAIIAYDRIKGGPSVSDLYRDMDEGEFVPTYIISKASLTRQGLPGPLGDALLYQAPVEGGVSEAESALMNIAELLGVVNDKDSILNAIQSLRYIRLATCLIAGLRSDVDNDTLTRTLRTMTAPKVDPSPLSAGEEQVRVLRVIEYTGPRKLVERQVQMSLHGTRGGLLRLPGENMPPASDNDYGPPHQSPVQITAVTLGEYPEVLEQAKPPAVDRARSDRFEAGLYAIADLDATTRARNVYRPEEERLSNVATAMAIAREALGLDTAPAPVPQSAPQPDPAAPAEAAQPAAAARPESESPISPTPPSDDDIPF